jgi:hypothetical protein
VHEAWQYVNLHSQNETSFKHSKRDAAAYKYIIQQHRSAGLLDNEEYHSSSEGYLRKYRVEAKVKRQLQL